MNDAAAKLHKDGAGSCQITHAALEHLQTRNHERMLQA
jgi:hypothetical protein